MAKSGKHSSNTLSFKEKLMRVHRFYGVEILYLEPRINKIQYILECDYLGYEGSTYLYRLTRQKMYVNNKPLTGMMDVLAEKCMSCVYPLILKVSFSGKIRGVQNLEEIKQKWVILRERLEMEYDGKIVDDYLNRIEKAISTEKIFLQKMKNDIIFKLLVPRLHAWGAPNFEVEGVKMKIPHPNASGRLIFKGKQELFPYPDENNQIKASYSGQYHESDLVNMPDDAKGQLSLNYHLDNEDASMIRMNGQFKFTGEKNYRVEYKIIRLKERELTKE